MRTTARIAIEKVPKQAKVSRSPLTTTGTLLLLGLLVGGLWLALMAH